MTHPEIPTTKLLSISIQRLDHTGRPQGPKIDLPGVKSITQLEDTDFGPAIVRQIER